MSHNSRILRKPWAPLLCACPRSPEAGLHTKHLTHPRNVRTAKAHGWVLSQLKERVLYSQESGTSSRDQNLPDEPASTTSASLLPLLGLRGRHKRGRRACTFAEREKDVLLCGCLSAACLLVSSDTQEGWASCLSWSRSWAWVKLGKEEGEGQRESLGGGYQIAAP